MSGYFVVQLLGEPWIALKRTLDHGQRSFSGQPGVLSGGQAARMHSKARERLVDQPRRIPRRNAKPHIPVFRFVALKRLVVESDLLENALPDDGRRRRHEAVKQKRLEDVSRVEDVSLRPPSRDAAPTLVDDNAIGVQPLTPGRSVEVLDLSRQLVGKPAVVSVHQR